MIAAFRRIVILLCLHLAFFTCFPNTGALGILYGWASMALWFFIVQLTLKPLGWVADIFPGLFILCDMLIIAGAVTSLGLTLPQTDKTAPLAKIAAHHYPTRADISKGLAQFGVNVPASIEKAKVPDIKMPTKKEMEKLLSEVKK